MAKEVYLLFSTDTWLTRSSNTFIGVYSTKSKYITAAANHAKKEADEKMDSDDIYMLQNHYQTQGRTTNYLIEKSILE